MTEPSIRAAYAAACPGIAGRLLTAHEAAEADAMRAALSKSLLDVATDAAWNGHVWGAHEKYFRRAAWATVLALLLAPSPPEAT